MPTCQRGGMPTINLRHLARALVLLAVAALLAAGCDGSASSGNKSASQSSQDQLVKYVQCLRQHGDTSVGVQGGMLTNNTQPGQQGPSEPQRQAAGAACKQYAPNGGQASRPNAQQLDAMTKFAQCMRNHGIPMQDPNPQRGAGISPNSGVDPNSPQYQQAQQACQHYLPGNMSGPGS
jgi:hypothetical protein